MEYFDVVIIGAGPAGLKCAEMLGQSKLKVLILEKNATIGPKVCAEGLTRQSAKLINFSKDLITIEKDNVNIHINNSKFNVKFEETFLYTTTRISLGQWQLKKLKVFKNITIRKNARILKIVNDFIVLDNKKIKFKFLVGADGSNSIVRKHLGLKTEKMLMTLQYTLPNTKYKNFEVFFNSKLFKNGYAWIFPNKEYSKIGCCCNTKIISPERLKRNFEKWLQNQNVNILGAKLEAFIINYDYQGYKFKNIYLAGDAAGLASGLTGEGIYQALISGEEIAKNILDSKYESKEVQDLLKYKKRQEFLLKFLHRCGPFRTPIFYLGISLSKISPLKRKVIDVLA